MELTRAGALTIEYADAQSRWLAAPGRKTPEERVGR